MQTLSPMILIIYAMMMMSILLDFHLQNLPIKKRVGAILFAIAILLVNGLAVTILGQSQYGKSYLLLAQLPVFIGFAIFSRYRGIKLFFVLLSVVVFTAPPVLCVSTMRTFYPTNAAVGVVVFVISYLFMLGIVYKFIKPDFNYMLEYCESRNFWLFCIIPILHYVYSFSRTQYNFVQPFEKDGYFFTQLPTIIVLVSYILLIRVFRTTRENQQLESEKGMIDMQMETAKRQLNVLRSSQEQAVIYRHDMRHHFSMINSFAQQGELSQIMGYLSNAQQELTTIVPMRFCENETVNLLLSSFWGKAEKQATILNIKADLPKEINIPNTEICSVLSNGLENALNAVSEVEDITMRKVFVHCRVNRNMLLIEIENVYTGDIQMKNEIPTSEKTGHGYGCKSMRSIAEKRNGFCNFQMADGIFTLRVVLPMEKEQSCL